ncbi:MAG TPA: L,D-transpeptidase family protein [Anaerolineales bacterium]|nr:L,D-transpeptidase family protein [Anaerolineales bacterium]
MNNQFIEARELIAKAREALRRADKPAARQLGERAALLAPEMEDAWLVLAASDPSPEEALAYARKALELNPQSERARRGVEWASGHLKQAQATKDQSPAAPQIIPAQVAAVASLPKKRAYQTAVALPQLKSKGNNWLLPALLSGAGCMLIGLIGLFVLTSPAFASIVSSVSAPAPTQENLWAPADIAKPGVVPIEGNAFAAQAANTPASTMPTAPLSSSATPLNEPAFTATEAPTEAPGLQASTPEATETPGAMVMEIVADTPTSEYIAPKPPLATGNGSHWIDVDLTNQRVYAYEGDTVVNSFLVSTGTWLHPTVTGQYKVYIKLRSGNMSGPGYFLPDVPYIMYFYKSYGLHGTYWHHNFGTPMSHGCVNLQTDDAAWLYNWSSVGTVVNVHY